MVGDLERDRLLDELADLGAEVITLQHPSSGGIDGLALEVHDVVVLQHMLTDLEVLVLNPLLSVLDQPAEQAVLYALVLAPAPLKPLHPLLSAKEPPDLILQAEVEAR